MMDDHHERIFAPGVEEDGRVGGVDIEAEDAGVDEVDGPDRFRGQRIVLPN